MTTRMMTSQRELIILIQTSDTGRGIAQETSNKTGEWSVEAGADLVDMYTTDSSGVLMLSAIKGIIYSHYLNTAMETG